MKYIKYTLLFILGIFLLTLLPVVAYRFFPVAYTPVMLIKPGTIEHQWVDIKDISPSMKKAVMRAEDDKFYIHHGFDFEAIEKAMKFNQTHKRQKGASTISQQTAKNVFLWPSRSWLRKGMEAYFTVLIETIWGKDKILEVYLNVIELGRGVYGVEAAAKKYFHKKAKQLTNSEAALMAAVLPNPIKFKINKPSAYILKRQQKIMGHGPVEIKFDLDEDMELDLPGDLQDELPDESPVEAKSDVDTSTQVTPENSTAPTP
jgi:monofunctional biosynthetic peptidoglycan transglycosylase